MRQSGDKGFWLLQKMFSKIQKTLSTFIRVNTLCTPVIIDFGISLQFISLNRFTLLKWL